MAERARATAKQWRVSRLSEQPKEERQKRRTRAQSKPLEEAVLADARQFEDPESVQQCDAGNKQKAKQAAKLTMQEATTEEAQKLAVQGEWFRLADKARRDTQWGQVSAE